MFKTLLVTMLIAVATLPAAAQVGPGLGSSDHVIRRNITRYGKICTRDYNGYLSLRTGPGQGYRKITKIPNQRYVSLNYGRYSGDGFWWWNVNYNGYNGWSRADYICGDPQ